MNTLNKYIKMISPIELHVKKHSIVVLSTLYYSSIFLIKNALLLISATKH